MDGIQIGYAAGFVDGEGCIAIASNGALRLTVCQMVREPLDALHEAFGVGSICQTSSTGLYIWQVEGHGVIDVLEVLLPYLIVKKEQAKLALTYYDVTGGKGPVHRRRLSEQLKVAKRPWKN